MEESKVEIIVGPPGTGKTETLLRRAEAMISNGITPNRICFVTFTKKAALEAQTRAMEKFNLMPDDLPYFRTLHSLMFKELALARGSVLLIPDLLKICSLLGIAITLRSSDITDGTFTGYKKGDKLFFLENLARASCKSLKETWESMPDLDVDFNELTLLRDTLLEYKRINDKLDFTDMLTEFIRKEITVDIDALIVDEAQDLSRAQWKVVDLLSKKPKVVIIAGDDDQAIFRWAGADINYFIDMPGKEVVLHKSYRVPAKIHEFASEMIKQVSHRRIKEWTPIEDKGSVNFCMSPDEIDMSKGTWYLLVRNRCFLYVFEEYCIRMGYSFLSIGDSPIADNCFKAVRDWERLRKDISMSVADIRNIYNYMSVGNSLRHGAKAALSRADETIKLSLWDLRKTYGLAVETVWHEALDKLSAREREYFLTALKLGENLLKPPRININTIHGVKGGEADHVAVMLDMTAMTHNEYMLNMDDETRVFYVAFTRARKTLNIIEPITNRYFRLT